MTRKEFDEMRFEDLMYWAVENLPEVTEEDTLIHYAKDSIDNDDFHMAIWILSAIWENPYDTQYYLYDYTMGTYQVPTPITNKEDIADYIDFEEGENERTNTPDVETL